MRKCLLKYHNFTKPPLPWTISGCAPAYIWYICIYIYIYIYKQSDFRSLEPYWQHLQKSWLSSNVIPEKVTWVWFPARINTFYSKLPPVNYLLLKVLNQTGICHRFSCRISDQKTFSAMLHQNIVRQNKFFNFSPNFLHFLCWFDHSNNNSILDYI